ncbi:MAG: heavy-metal-associated domain-containing protein [Desulfobacterales bacterium]|nr:heavy-metal-associated domain-containing protein [Desulfobacterales bacterium]
MGKAALEGLAGVNQVENGFKNFKEINTVHYDPSLIKVKEMEQALEKAGTYLNTAN